MLAPLRQLTRLEGGIPSKKENYPGNRNIIHEKNVPPRVINGFSIPVYSVESVDYTHRTSILYTKSILTPLVKFLKFLPQLALTLHSAEVYSNANTDCVKMHTVLQSVIELANVINLANSPCLWNTANAKDWAVPQMVVLQVRLYKLCLVPANEKNSMIKNTFFKKTDYLLLCIVCRVYFSTSR